MGARIIKPAMPYHAIRIRSDGDHGELIVVGRSKRGVYLWAGRDYAEPVTFSGTATLRKLAQQILEIVGDE